MDVYCYMIEIGTDDKNIFTFIASGNLENIRKHLTFYCIL